MVIKDAVMGNIEIHYDGNSYSVIEYTGSVDKNGKSLYKTHAYCSSVKNALVRVSKIIVEKTSDVLTIKEYVKRINDITEKITKTLD